MTLKSELENVKAALEASEHIVKVLESKPDEAAAEVVKHQNTPMLKSRQ